MKQYLFSSILCLSLCLSATFTVKAQTADLDIDLTGLSCNLFLKINWVSSSSSCATPGIIGTTGYVWTAPGMYNYDNVFNLPTGMNVNDQFLSVEWLTWDPANASPCIPGGTATAYSVDVCSPTTYSGGPFDIQDNQMATCNCSATNIGFTWTPTATPPLLIIQ